MGYYSPNLNVSEFWCSRVKYTSCKCSLVSIMVGTVLMLYRVGSLVPWNSSKESSIYLFSTSNLYENYLISNNYDMYHIFSDRWYALAQFLLTYLRQRNWGYVWTKLFMFFYCSLSFGFEINVFLNVSDRNSILLWSNQW